MVVDRKVGGLTDARHIGKTVTMKFWHDKSNFSLTINGKSIPLVDSTKFLGVIIDNTLAWHYHVNHLINKLNNNKRLLLMS